MEVSILVNVIIVDDENLAVDYMEAMLNRFDYISVVGKYYNPFDALNNLANNQIDIAFLDIHMPEFSGIELAKAIIEQSPHTQIVFTTGHDTYAIKAFELYATDYLLKPLTFARIEKSVKRCMEQLKHTPKQPKETYTVCAFHSLTFIKNNNWEQPIIIRWRTAKVRSIFCYLLHYNHVTISKDALIELFWPELDLDKAYTQLYNTVYQIRKGLTDHGIPIEIKNLGDAYSLQLNDVKYHVQLFKERIQNLSPINENNIDEYHQVLNYYRGEFLKDENYLWTESEREALRVLWLQHLTAMADFYEANKNIKEAISLYLHLQSIDPFYEQSYVKLVQLYLEIGHSHSAHSQSEQLQKLLHDETELNPV